MFTVMFFLVTNGKRKVAYNIYRRSCTEIEDVPIVKFVKVFSEIKKIGTFKADVEKSFSPKVLTVEGPR